MKKTQQNLITLFQTIDASTITEEKLADKSKIITQLKYFSDYYVHVVNMELFICENPKLEGASSYLFKVKDEERRVLHNTCIKSCEELNRIGNKYGVGNICNFKIENRHEVAIFVGKVINSIYWNEIDR